MKKYILPVFWAIMIFSLSSIPGTKLPLYFFPGFDKVVHIIEYAILAFLWCRVFRNNIFLTVILCVFFGLIDEIHQLYVPMREFSLLDLSADMLGCILGALCLLLLRKWKLAH